MQTAIIILGGGLTPNLELNEHTRQRFDKAIELISKNKYDKIICSTDKSYRKLKEIQNTSEARVGKQYLVDKGINPVNIRLEEKSRDTMSNAYYCRTEIIDEEKIKNITIVTSKFLMKKTKYLFELVFPKKEFNLTFEESENGNVDEEQLKNRNISENLVILFYKNHLSQDYEVIPGDMKSIQTYIEEHNPSFTGIKDKLHSELTKEIKNKISEKDPLY